MDYIILIPYQEVSSKQEAIGEDEPKINMDSRLDLEYRKPIEPTATFLLFWSRHHAR